MPRQDLGIDNKENSVIQESKQELPCLSCETQEHDYQCHRRHDCRFVLKGSGHNWRDKTWHPLIEDWIKIHFLLESSNGPVFSIMLIRRWSSTAFLKYTREQVQEFLQGISSKMIKVQSFKHVKNQTETNPM